MPGINNKEKHLRDIIYLGSIRQIHNGLALLLLIVLGFSGTSLSFAHGVKPDNDTHLVIDVYSNALLGSAPNGQWLDQTQTYSRLRGLIPQVKYHVYKNNQRIESDVRLKSMKIADKWYERLYSFKLSSKSKKGIALADNISWDLFPRKVKNLSVNSPVYKKIIQRYLETKGVYKPQVNIQKIWQVDLDGNGQNEVLIEASMLQQRPYTPYNSAKNLDKQYQKFGDYSLVLLRSLNETGDGVRYTIVSTDSYIIPDKFTKQPSDKMFTYTELVNIMDIDGDGNMEVMVYSYDNNSLFTGIYELKNRQLINTGRLDTVTKLMGKPL